MATPTVNDMKTFLEALDRYLEARDAWKYAMSQAHDPEYVRNAKMELEQAGINLWMSLSVPFQLMK